MIHRINAFVSADGQPSLGSLVTTYIASGRPNIKITASSCIKMLPTSGLWIIIILSNQLRSFVITASRIKNGMGTSNDEMVDICCCVSG